MILAIGDPWKLISPILYIRLLFIFIRRIMLYLGQLRWMRCIGAPRFLSGRFAALGFAARDLAGFLRISSWVSI